MSFDLIGALQGASSQRFVSAALASQLLSARLEPKAQLLPHAAKRDQQAAPRGRATKPAALRRPRKGRHVDGCRPVDVRARRVRRDPPRDLRLPREAVATALGAATTHDDTEVELEADAKTYSKHGVTEALNRAVEQVIKERPSDPCAAIGRMLGGSDAATSQLPTSTAAREYTDLHQLEQKLSRAASKAVAENGPVPLQRIAALLLEEEAATAPQSGQSLPTALDAAVHVVAAAAPSDLVAFLKERLAAVGDPESAEKEGGGPAKPSGAEGTAPAAPIASAPRLALRRPSLSPTSEDATIAALDGESIVARLRRADARGGGRAGPRWRPVPVPRRRLWQRRPPLPDSRHASRVVRFNPADGSHTPIGDDLGEEKVGGGVLCDDGCIYALPDKASRALRIDPAKGTAAPFGDDVTGLGCVMREGTVAGQTACCTASHESTAVLCFDPATARRAPSASCTGFKYPDGVLASDGCIYAAHGSSARRIDPVARGDDDRRRARHQGRAGSPARSAAMAASTSRPVASRVLRIDPTTQTVELIGDELGEGTKWAGAFRPRRLRVRRAFGDKQLLRIDPIAGTAVRSARRCRRTAGFGHDAADGTVWALPLIAPSPCTASSFPARQLLGRSCAGTSRRCGPRSAPPPPAAGC